MKIFITGASGFVGGAAARRLADQHDLYAMARSPRSADKVRANGCTPITCSLDDVQPEHLQQCDAVIHAAAFVEPWGTRQEFWHANVTGTERMLKVAQEAGAKRFVHIGTEAALFDGSDMVQLDETAPYPPRTPFLYSETKREAEIRVLKADVPNEFTTISLRPRLVWGPGDTTILKNLVELVDNGSFRWINRGAAKTSICYIDHISQAIEAALTRGRGGHAYFITDEEDCTMRELITEMLATQDREPGNRNVPKGLAMFLAGSIETVWKLFGIKKKPPVTRFSVAITSAECTLKNGKARQELGYAPEVDFKTGMKRLAGLQD